MIFYSVFFILAATFLLSLSQGFKKSAVDLIAGVIVPIGVVGCLIGTIAILSNMSDPDGLIPAIFVSALPFGYALIISGLVTKHDHWAKEVSNDLRYKSVGTLALYCLILWVMNLAAGVDAFIHLSAIVFVVLALALLVLFNLVMGQPWFDAIQSKLIGLGLLGLLLGLLAAFVNSKDPRSIGTAIAFGYLSLMYCLLIFISCRIWLPADLSRQTSSHYPLWLGLGVPFMLGIVGSFWIIIMSFA